MKYLVLESFIDKNTLIGYNKGGAFESEDSERVSFLNENGFIHALNNHQPTGEVDTIEDLKSQAKELGIKGYTKLTEEELHAAIEAKLAEKASE